MQEKIKPVSIGLFFGLAGLIFGILWAIYLVAGHESIHKTLAQRGKAALAEKFVVGQADKKDAGHMHSSHEGATGGDALRSPEAEEHEDPLMEEAHERLVRGHLHAMGLGLVAIAVSLILAFLDAPVFVKTAGSICAGAGGLLYPFSWIVMGFRTTAMGEEAAAESVLPIVAISIPLVLIGLFLAIFFLVFKGFGKGR